MQDKANRRRFIAGAVCPRCARMDKILMNLDTGRQECVVCGFSEERPGPDQPVATMGDTDPIREMPTRVSRAAARRVETPAQTITLIDPGRDEK